ncbi:hypothetical protein O181_003161 [Austropuccinia psidii MF-1]|uniref:Reverse transcriptase n=1 Tax=Austropuccinia psidii MF-1 TaxID=1389203 RepID=A0A9Q3BED6_9BASI|nr:hypothetical protein [Austropuccinia psidii MF-1]
MGDAIREHSDDDQDPREEFLEEYQEEPPLEIQDIQLEAGIPQDTANKNLFKHTQDAQSFLVTPTKGMEYIHGTATKKTVCIYNAQHPLIIDSGAHCSTVARNYLDNHFPNWENQLFPTKAKNFKSSSGKMTSIGTIIKEMIIPHRKGNIRITPEFFVLDYSHIQEFLLATDYQRMHGIDIYYSKSREITIGTNKEKKFSLDIYQISSQDPLEELLNGFLEGTFSTTLTSKKKLSLLKMPRKNTPAFAIGKEPLGTIRGHDIELTLDVERPYPPMLRRPPYPESLETRRQIEKHINDLLDIDITRKIEHNEIVEITTPVLITWHDGKSRLCGDFSTLNNYTKADRYPIPRISHALDKLAKTIYKTKMDCMKGFHQNGVNPNCIKLLRIICHMGIYEYTRMPFGIENSLAHFQRMMNTILQEEILEGWMVVYSDDIIIYSETWEDHVQYIDKVPKLLALGHKVPGISLKIDQKKVAAVLQKPVPRKIREMQSFLGVASYYRKHIKDFSHISSSLYKLCSKDVVFEITKEKMDAYERVKYALTNAPVLIFPDFELPFKLYKDAACSQGLGAALHQTHIVDGEPREGLICYISRQLKDSEARYGATQTECLFLVWVLGKLHYDLQCAVFEAYTDFTALKYLLNMKTTNRHMLRWKIAIREYRGNIIIIYKEGKSNTNADCLRKYPLDNVKSNTAYDPEAAAKIPIHFMEIDRKNNFRVSEWAPESGNTDSEQTETPILGISSLELHNEFFNAVIKTYAKHKQCGILLQLL